MLNTTTWTADTLKTKLSTYLADTRITAGDIRLALNFFYALLFRARRATRRTDNVAISSGVSVTSSGYDLSLLTDIGNIEEGFEVFNGSIKKENKLNEVQPEDSRLGYYIVDTTLYLTGLASGTLFFKYQKKSPRIDDETSLEAHDLKIDQDLEQAVFRFCADSFYDGKFQYDKAMANEDKYYQLIQAYFDRPTKTKALNIW